MGTAKRQAATRVKMALAVLTVMVVLATGCAKQEQDARVERRDITAYLELDGEVLAPPTEKADIKAPYTAPVSKIYVTVGKAVKEGDVIMELAAPQDEAYYQQARSRLQQAEQALRQARSTYQPQLSAAQQQLQQAEADVQAARQALETPPPDGTGSDPMRPDLDIALEQRRQAQMNFYDTQAQVEQAVSRYEQQVETARLQFADAQAGVKGAMVRSPIDGTVITINAEIGDEVSVEDKEPLATVVDLSALKVYAEVEQDDLGHIEIDSPVVLQIEDLPTTEMEGKVTGVTTEKAGFLKGAKYVAIISFENTDGEAKPDMDADVLVKVGEVTDVLAVPASAVKEAEEDRYIVKVRRDGEWRDTVVEPGLSDGEYVEIRSGLEEGDVVLVNP